MNRYVRNILIFQKEILKEYYNLDGNLGIYTIVTGEMS